MLVWLQFVVGILIEKTRSLLFWKSGKYSKLVSKSRSIGKFHTWFWKLCLLPRIPTHLDEVYFFSKSRQELWIHFQANLTVTFWVPANEFGKIRMPVYKRSLQKHCGLPTRGHELCNYCFADVKAVRNICPFSFSVWNFLPEAKLSRISNYILLFI